MTVAQLFDFKNPWFRQGFKDFALLWPAVLSWGLVTGVAMVKSGLSIPWAVFMSLTVFAGSAQLAAIALIAVHASVVVVVLTAGVMNLRFVVFSAGIVPFLRHLPLPQRLLLGYLNGDMGYALMMQKLDDAPKGFTREAQVHYHFGLSASNWGAWQLSSMVGIAMAQVFPVAWGLEFAAILALMGLLASLIKDRAGVLCLMSASTVALLTVNWPYRLGLLAALGVGVASALMYNSLFQNKETT